MSWAQGQARQSCTCGAHRPLSGLPRVPSVSDENTSACGGCQDHRATPSCGGPCRWQVTEGCDLMVPSASETSPGRSPLGEAAAAPRTTSFTKPSAERQPLNCSQGEKERWLIHQAGTQNSLGKKQAAYTLVYTITRKSLQFLSFGATWIYKKALGIIPNTGTSLVVNVGVDTVTPGEQGVLAAVFFSSWFSRGRVSTGEGTCTWSSWPSIDRRAFQVRILGVFLRGTLDMDLVLVPAAFWFWLLSELAPALMWRHTILSVPGPSEY